MKLAKYPLKSDDSLTIFEFVSIGYKGHILKQIHFQPTDTDDVYNLAFGDLLADTGEIDDLAVTNNGDTDKVLATVGTALYLFSNQYPNAFVYATGSTPARTRLYRMGISRFYDEISEEFEVYGRIGETFYNFQTGKDYEGFLVQRKSN